MIWKKSKDCNIIFSDSNNCIDGSLDIGPDSVILSLKHLVQELTLSYQENPLAAGSLLLSQRQDFLSNRLARLAIIPRQEGTMEMVDKALKSRRTRYGHNRVSCVWSGRSWILLGKRSAGCRCCLQITHQYTFFPFNFQSSGVGFNGWKPDCDWQRARQRKRSSSSTNNSSLREMNPTHRLMRSQPFGTKV